MAYGGSRISVVKSKGQRLWVHSSVGKCFWATKLQPAQFKMKGNIKSVAARCVTEAFSTTGAVHIEDCERQWVSSCHGSVAEHWWLKPEVCWVRLLATAFTFLYFRHLTSKFSYFQREAKSSEQKVCSTAKCCTKFMSRLYYHLRRTNDSKTYMTWSLVLLKMLMLRTANAEDC